MPSEQPQRPDVRVGHADRDRIIEILGVAAGEGRLTIEELEARIEQASAARFESELQALIADLPQGAAGNDQQRQLERPSRLPVPSDAWAPPGALDLHAVWTGIVRGGEWKVPEWIIATPQWSSVVLNFLEAILPAGGIINVEVRGGWGTFLAVLPPGWGIDRSGLASKSAWTTATFDAPERPAPGKPLLRLVGSQGDGWLVVRGERWWDKYIHRASKN